MQTAVSALASRTKLLDPSQLEQVESRLAVVQQRLTQIAEKKDVLEQSGKLNKVFKLSCLLLIYQVSRCDFLLHSLTLCLSVFVLGDIFFCLSVFCCGLLFSSL